MITGRTNNRSDGNKFISMSNVSQSYPKNIPFMKQNDKRYNSS